MLRVGNPRREIIAIRHYPRKVLVPCLKIGWEGFGNKPLLPFIFSWQWESLVYWVLSIITKIQKFCSEVKWKGSFRFGLYAIFGTASGGGSLCSVRPKLAASFWQTDSLPFFSSVDFHLWGGLGKKYKMVRTIPLCSDRSLCHNEKHQTCNIERKW